MKWETYRKKQEHAKGKPAIREAQNHSLMRNVSSKI